MLSSKSAGVLALLISLPCSAAPPCHRAIFSGQVSGEQTYRRALGMGLGFRMEPLGDHWGWTYEIGPVDLAPEELDSYVYALNPPYRGRNITDLSIQYATPAQDAVAKSRLEFWFLARRADGIVASNALKDILWPKTDLAQELALAKLGSLAMGQGSLQITDADFRPGTSRPGEVSPNADYGAIFRINFTVSITVPSDFRLEQDLTIEEAACPDSSRWMKQWEH